MSFSRRVAGWAGVAFVVALVVQFAVAPAPPAFDASGEEIRDYLVDNRTGMLTQGFLQVIAMGLGVVFFVGLAARLRAAPDGAAWSAIVLVAAAILAGTVLVGQAAFDALVWIDGNAELAGDDVARLSWSFAYLMFGAAAPVVALITGSTALLGFRSNAMPAYVSWVAAVAAVASLGALTMQLGSDFGGAGFAPYLGIMVFALATSIAMLRTEGATG